MANSYQTSEDILKKIAELIYKNSGINFPDSHMKVLDQRIQQRIKDKSFHESDLYSNLLINKDDLFEFIGFVTTNHTHFFRSIEQFHVLGSTILPELLQKNSHIKHICIWSSACSSGEEPYTLALYLHHFFKTRDLNGWSFSIIATDIDQSSINTAIEGRYPFKSLSYVPAEYHQYINTHKNPQPSFLGEDHDKYITFDTDIQKTIRFQNHNLLNNPPFKNIDIIFCRNVLIYFDFKTQEKVIRQLSTSLSNDRYLFISPAESITGLDVPFKPTILPHTIYYTNK